MSRSAPRPVVIRVDPPGEAEERLWRKVLDLAVEFGPDDGWCLIGGLMVQLFGYEHGSGLRPTGDIDVLGDARSRPSMIERLAQTLDQLKATMTAPPATDPTTGYRFELEGQTIELLGPDGLAEDPKTLGSFKTIQVGGGTQALHRTEQVPVSLAGSEPVTVRRPTLVAAILLKARAVRDIRDRLAEHREDLIRLLSFVEDPRALAGDEELTKNERRWLRVIKKDLVWTDLDLARLFPTEDLTRARQTYELLIS